MPSVQVEVRRIRIISIIQMIVGLTIIGIPSYIYDQYHFTDKMLESMMIWILSVACLPTAFLSYYRFEREMKRAESKPLNEKLIAYRSAAIIRNLIVEAVSLLFTISFFLTGSNVLQLEAILGAFIMVFFYPSDLRMTRELRIEIQELE